MARTNLVAMSFQDATKRGRTLAERTREESEAAIEADAEQREAYQTSGLPPDWLTTGLAGAGAGWLFGPIGALIMGGVAAITTKRRREGIAVQAQADAETAASLIEGGDTALKRLEETAETDEERLEASLLRDRYGQAVALAQNPDAGIAVEGFRELLAIPGLTDTAADEIEQARRDREKRDQDKLQQEVGNLATLSDDYRQESQRFIDIRNSYQDVISSFDEPNGAGDVRGVYTFLKMLDPGSTIMPGELALASNTGGAVEAFRGMYNRLLEGESLTPVQRTQFLNEAREAFENAQRQQLEINSRYMERGRQSDIRDGLLSTLTINADPLAASSYRTPDPLGREQVNQVPEGAQIVNNDGTMASIVDYWSQFGKEALTAMDDSVYSYDAANEQWYQTDTNGQVFQIPSAPPGFPENPAERSTPPPDPADTNFDGEVSFLESMRDPERQAQRMQESRDRELLTPGLFQVGGVFGRDRTPEEEARRQELLRRQQERETNQ